MSVFLFLEKETEQKARIMCVHNFPDMLSEKEKQNGVLVDLYNEPEHQEGKIALPYWNYETKEVFFEYVDAQLSDNERIKQLEEKLALMEAAFANLSVH